MSSDFKAWIRVGISSDVPKGLYWFPMNGNNNQRIVLYETDELLVLWATASVNPDYGPGHIYKPVTYQHFDL